MEHEAIEKTQKTWNENENEAKSEQIKAKD